MQKKLYFCMFFSRIMLFDSNILHLLRILPCCKKQQEKMRLRELLSQKRRMLTPEMVHENSNKLVALIEHLPAFQSAQTVLIYYPIRNEIDVLSLIKKYKQTKTFLFPVVQNKSMIACPYDGNEKMHRGKYNIPEPTTLPYDGKIDLTIVPGVAFDAKGNRLGRGGGYYDRYITTTKSHSLLVGVGYDFQIIDKVPTNILDKHMDYVIAPTKGIIKIKRD